MGILVAKKYRTKLFLRAADHTYVECGTGGKAWSCWGGKTGGVGFNQGTGSTERADRIAESDERAGITRYLVNGVCHQAANRILFPAGILVSAARGYRLSQALFGTYGRASVRGSSAPFNQHGGVRGDLKACIGATSVVVKGDTRKAMERPAPGAEGAQIGRIKELYDRFYPDTATPEDAIRFNLGIFTSELDYLSPDTLDNMELRGLLQAIWVAEIALLDLTSELTNRHTPAVEFVRNFNFLTEIFQTDCANALGETKYRRWLELEPDEHILLADPDALDVAFGEGTARSVYGELPSPTD